MGNVAIRMATGDRPVFPAGWESALPAICALIQKCWVADPRERPTFEDIRDDLNALPEAHDTPEATGEPPLPSVKELLDEAGLGNYFEYFRDSLFVVSLVDLKEMAADVNMLEMEAEDKIILTTVMADLDFRSAGTSTLSYT